MISPSPPVSSNQRSTPFTRRVGMPSPLRPSGRGQYRVPQVGVRRLAEHLGELLTGARELRRGLTLAGLLLTREVGHLDEGPAGEPHPQAPDQVRTGGPELLQQLGTLE